MHRRNSRRTALVLSAAAVAAVPLLTACGDDAHPGAAAVVGSDRITVSQLENRVNEVRDAQQTATKDDQQYEQAIAKSGSLTRNTLHSMVFDRVLHRAAADAGVGVSRRQIQERVAAMAQQAGGVRQMRLALLEQYNIAPERIADSARTDLEVMGLAQKVGANMQSQSASDQAPFWKALDQASKELHVDLNPRYGTWDIAKSHGRADAKTPWVREVTSPKTGDEQTA